MELTALILNSILLGIGLAMDAFSVSIANGFAEPGMKKSKMVGIAGTFAIFQIVMPIIGWFCVHYIVEYFNAFEPFIPYIALILLCYIGGKMIIECIRDKKKDRSETTELKKLTFGALMVQGVATSIDALSVGFTIESYSMAMAFLSAGIIGVVTMGLCMIALLLGRKIGNKLDKAEIIGGIILIGIGLEIFIKGVFF